jgi:hypothetical protein
MSDTYIVECQRAGYLKLPILYGEHVKVGDEYSVVLDIGEAFCCSKEKAERFAAELNQREMHKHWRAAPWDRAYADWKAVNGK